MKPRARDVIGALVLAAVLVALVVWVVILASPRSLSSTAWLLGLSSSGCPPTWR